MLKLISKSPLNGMKPIKVGSLVLSEITSVNMFTIQPFKNKTKTVSKELKKLFHLELPGDGKSLVAKDNTIMWIGMGQYLFLGNKVESISAAITDQSDAWTVVELVGVGYRAALKEKQLNLQLGYSHDINFDIPEGIKIVVEKQTTVKVSGSDKQQVGMVCSKIKSFRKPEPYKGKGIREKGQYILRKEGKKK